jgi:ParB-like chromosome segregation protein Spo0J
MQKLEYWPIDRLIEYARNPRKNDHAVDRVASVIHEFGFRVPILAKSDGSVIDGHLRIKAARKLKLEKVPVIICDDMTETQIKAFRLSVNKVAELADWDEEMLGLELADLREADFDFWLMGFDADEIERALNPPEPTNLEKEWQEAEMPDYDGSPKGQGGTIIVHFPTLNDRAEFGRVIGMLISDEAKFCWYPSKPE